MILETPRASGSPQAADAGAVVHAKARPAKAIVSFPMMGLFVVRAGKDMNATGIGATWGGVQRADSTNSPAFAGGCQFRLQTSGLMTDRRAQKKNPAPWEEEAAGFR